MTLSIHEELGCLAGTFARRGASERAKVCRDASDRITALELQLATSQAEVERLRAIVDRLPKTADGVPMIPGTHYWAWCSDRFNNDDEQSLLELIWKDHSSGEQEWEYTCVDLSCDWEILDLDDGPYSTREAAEAARAAGGGE